MISKFVKGKVCVFIDAANILYSQKNLGWRIDYQKLKTYFEQECELVELYLYTGKIGKDHKQAKFLNRMIELWI
ncbi:MAG: NYN domain-containing protein [Candidatus Pacebacteria bacterium]|nr:NYN domain-containing protein [Candidatus Paceibacterota bacterium]